MMNYLSTLAISHDLSPAHYSEVAMMDTYTLNVYIYHSTTFVVVFDCFVVIVVSNV